MAQVLAVPYVNLKTFAVMQRYFAFIGRGDGTLSLKIQVRMVARRGNWVNPSAAHRPALERALRRPHRFSPAISAPDGSGINTVLCL